MNAPSPHDEYTEDFVYKEILQTGGLDRQKEEMRKYPAATMEEVFQNHKAPINMLTNPGPHWGFERKCLEHFPNARFVGIECNPKTFKQMQANAIRYGIDDSCTAVHRRLCWFVLNYRGNARFNSVWLDTYTTINDELDATLTHLHRLLDPEADKIPVCVTFVHQHQARTHQGLIAEQPGGTLWHRKLNLLQSCLSNEQWEYEITIPQPYKRGNEDSHTVLTVVNGILHRL